MLIIESGIPKLDEMLGGGFKKGSNTLFLTTPGLDSSLFLFQTAYTNIGKKRNCIYYSDSKFPSAIKDQMCAVKLWEKKRFEDIIFIDGFSGKTGIPSKEKFFVEIGGGIEEAGSIIDSVIKKKKDELVFFYDNYENIIMEKSPDEALKLLDGIISSVLDMYGTSFFSLTNWNFSESFINEIKKRFEYVVMIDAVEEKMLMRNYFYIEKSPKEFLKFIVPFRAGLDGIGVYVPKILVTGPYHSGKSSFIQKISTKAVSVDRMGTTVALDHGYIDYGGIGADLFGTPGQERFEFMLDILKKDTFGIILVVDSTDPETYKRANEMLKHVRKEAIPYLIAANKQDLSNALSIEEIKKKIDFPEEMSIISTSAVTGKGCLDAVKALIDLVIYSKRVKN